MSQQQFTALQGLGALNLQPLAASVSLHVKWHHSWWSLCASSYATAWARLSIGLARAGRGLAHLHLLSGPGFSQNFHVIVTGSVSSVCHMSRLKFCVPDSS